MFGSELNVEITLKFLFRIVVVCEDVKLTQMRKQISHEKTRPKLYLFHDIPVLEVHVEDISLVKDLSCLEMQLSADIQESGISNVTLYSPLAEACDQ